MSRKFKCESDISRKPQREPRCLLRLAGQADRVFDTINTMATDEPEVPEFLKDIVYEADPAWPFPLGMTAEEWEERFEKAIEKTFKPCPGQKGRLDFDSGAC